MSLIGINGSSVIIDSDYKDNTVVIGWNCDVHLKSLIIQHGSDSGIVNYGKISIDNSYIQNSENGIVNHGNLSIHGSKIKNNRWRAIFNKTCPEEYVAVRKEVINSIQKVLYQEKQKNVPVFCVVLST